MPLLFFLPLCFAQLFPFPLLFHFYFYLIQFYFILFYSNPFFNPLFGAIILFCSIFKIFFIIQTVVKKNVSLNVEPSIIILHQTSDGSAECFPDLKVGVYKEIVPMGVDPDIITYRSAGREELAFIFP